MLTTLILFAQEEGKIATPEVPFWQNPIMLLPIMFGLLYFLVLRPQQKKQRQEQENMMASLKKNDEVVTAAGIIGIVSHIKENGDEVTLKIDDNARIQQRWRDAYGAEAQPGRAAVRSGATIGQPLPDPKT